MHITDLPYILFLRVINHLSPVDIIRCRRLSSTFREALLSPDLNLSIIIAFFPRSQEGRHVRHVIRSHGRASLIDDGDSRPGSHWADVFARLARRYFHLDRARPWRSTSLRQNKPADARFRAVRTWNKFLQLDERKDQFHYPDPMWTFDPSLGVLVYQAYGDDKYRARDLVTAVEVDVPFDLTGKITRRVRLQSGILVMEWCEQEPCHPPNAGDKTHRHCATAFDVVVARSTTGEPRHGDDRDNACRVQFRAEWKIHDLDMPLSYHDRFFSTHNETHYAVYLWQPSRFAWVDPTERLAVWEIGPASAYRQSQDPIGEHCHASDFNCPKVILCLGNADLDAWGVRQRQTPCMRSLALDQDTTTCGTSGHVFVIEEEHRWAAGPHSSTWPPRLHRVKSTGIPLTGHGPRWVDECGGGDDGDLTSSFCWRGPSRNKGQVLHEVWASALRQQWDPHLTWPGRAPCWRHDDFPYLTVSEVNDAPAGVRFSARKCFMLETLSVNVPPRLSVAGVKRTAVPSSGEDWFTDGGDAHGEGSVDSLLGPTMDTGLPGTRRWHGSDSDECGPGARADKEDLGSCSGGDRCEGPYGEEVQFGDEMWRQLLGAGHIVGNEKWIVGEDRDQNIHILAF